MKCNVTRQSATWFQQDDLIPHSEKCVRNCRQTHHQLWAKYMMVASTSRQPAFEVLITAINDGGVNQAAMSTATLDRSTVFCG